MLAILADACFMALDSIFFKIAVAAGIIVGFVYFIMAIASAQDGQNVFWAFVLWFLIVLAFAVVAFIILFLILIVGALILLLIGGGLGIALL